MNSSALAAGLRYLRGKLAAQQRHEESDELLLQTFTSRRDDDAFAVLVQRHGPMVLHVCRRVLGHEQDAEDAFQATFLVLARNAAALRNKTALAGWLHGIAYRTALKAKQSAARRRKHEGQAPSRSPLDPSDELSWREVRSLLDEEIARLPEIYRSVFVLCCLEELSRGEAAQRLGLKEGTVLKRLGAARKRLGNRLARRGVELTAVLAASALPAGLRAATIQAALAITAGENITGVISASVAELAQNATAAVAASKIKLTAVLALTVSLLGSAGVCLLTSPQRQQGQPLLSLRAGEQTADAPRSAKREPAKMVEISGRVVDPDGKPVRGAKLLLLSYFREESLHKKIWAASDGEGRFRIDVPRGSVDVSRWGAYIMAKAEGFGFAVAQLDKSAAADLTLRLVKDDIPIRGRILDLQGRPVAGAHVRIGDTLYVPKNADLATWLAALKDPKRNRIRWWTNYLTDLNSPAFDLLFPTVTTGADGRFCIKGIGRERVAELRIEGPTIATQAIHAMTRTQEAIYLPQHIRYHPKRRPVSYFGSNFDVAVPPTRPVVGIVRDKDSGKPLVGVTIKSVLAIDETKYDFLHTVTDKEGRYQLIGLPKGDYNEIAAMTNDFSSPNGNDLAKHPAYLPAVKKVANPRGIEPVTVDFALKRGVWVKGRVTDKSTGKSLMATVKYFCFFDNPDAEELHAPHSLYPYNLPWTDSDGSFLVLALPGRGLIGALAHQDDYIRGVGAERIRDSESKAVREQGGFSTFPHYCYARDFHALIEINPKRGDAALACNIALEPGRSLKGTVLDPDGKPLSGVRVSGLKDKGYWRENTGPDFTVESLQPNTLRVLQFVHKRKKFAGVFVLRGDEKVPISVRLQPWGMLTGQLLAPGGKPLSGAEVRCMAFGIHTDQDGRFPMKGRQVTLDQFPLAEIQTDEDGRFRIEGLAAGLKYGLIITKENHVRHIVGGDPEDLTIEAGQTKNLGDLRVKPEGE